MENIRKQIRWVRQLQISLHAAHACYFIALSIFPMLVLMLGLLRYTSLEVGDLQEFAEGFLPEPLYAFAWQLISAGYAGTSRMVLSVSALAALWSAGRGIYGLIRGLDAVYGRCEDRRWLQTRAISAVYTFLFLLVLLLTLVLHVFGNTLVQLLEQQGFRFPVNPAALRFFLPVAAQTLLFCAMFMFLPRGGNRFPESLPGALFASAGWMTVSAVFSEYVRLFTGYATIFGSVYTVALGMLWLYVCISTVFYGGVLNRFLKDLG